MSFIKYHKAIEETDPIHVYGRVSKLAGLVIEGHGPGSSIGAICEVYSKDEKEGVEAEVVGFKEDKIQLMAVGEVRGLGPGSKIIARGSSAVMRVGPDLLNRVLDGLGNPIDGKGPLSSKQYYPIYSAPVNPLSRRRIDRPLDLGIRAINGLLTCGMGQRMGIFAGSGVGKSVLMGMIARNTSADVNVIALIGERGREVKEFIERDLRAEGLARSVVVVATSDQPPLVRLRGAYIAATIAEYFRDQGKQVILMMDSLTRFAMAQREVGLAVGEPPTTKGYTPSVFSLLPKLLERAGTSDNQGSITGLYTVLVEEDDMNEPIADASRAVLDGHIILSRELATLGHYPAIDVLNSASRVMMDIVPPTQMEWSRRLLEALAVYRRAEDLIHIGAYKSGSNVRIDDAVRMIDKIQAYLRQGVNEKVDYKTSVQTLQHLFERMAP